MILSRNNFIFLIIVAIYASVWYQMGFDTPAINDNYATRLHIDEGIVFRNDMTRLFGNLPTLLGNMIDSSGFYGTNFVLLFFNIARVYLIFAILHKLTDSFYISLFTSLIYSVVPTDASLFWQGSLGMHFGIVMFFLSLLLLVISIENKNKAIIFLIVISLTISLLTYPGYLLLAIGFPIFIYYYGDKKLVQDAWGFITRPYLHLRFYTTYSNTELKALSLPLMTGNVLDYDDKKIIIHEKNERYEYTWQNVYIYKINSDYSSKPIYNLDESDYFDKIKNITLTYTLNNFQIQTNRIERLLNRGK